jgi:hypothetical protein
MTTNLHAKKTPEPQETDWVYGIRFKQIIARKFYDHDGSCSGDLITLGLSEVEWFEGVFDAITDKEDRNGLQWVIDVIRSGGSIDLWIE